VGGEIFEKVSPLFVGEILRNLAESGAIFRKDHRWTYSGDIGSLGIPEGVREAIGRRLARLSESTNKVLTQAAVIGREFDLNLLARIAEMPEDDILDALDEAKAAALTQEVSADTEQRRKAGVLRLKQLPRTADQDRNGREARRRRFSIRQGFRRPVPCVSSQGRG
jgi:predicted ATPase